MATKQIDLKALLASKTEGLKPAPNAAQNIERAEKMIPKNLMFSAESDELVTEPTAATSTPCSIEEAVTFNEQMKAFIDSVLLSGTDYGIIPHCSKPSLLKSGAEKILNFLNLIPRVCIIGKTEDFAGDGFFAYTVKVSLIDNSGVIRAEGLGSCNTREPKYVKSTGFASMNTVLKMSKKRALVDATLNVACVSSHFTQDVEDMNIVDDNNSSPAAPSRPQTERPASQKQLAYIERLMSDINTTPEKVNAYLQKNFGVSDYKTISGNVASKLIEALLAGKK